MNNPMIMPWGDYKGHIMSDIPSYYLYWLFNSEIEISDEIFEAAQEEYYFRTKINKHWGIK